MADPAFEIECHETRTETWKNYLDKENLLGHAQAFLHCDVKCLYVEGRRGHHPGCIRSPPTSVPMFQHLDSNQYVQGKMQKSNARKNTKNNAEKECALKHALNICCFITKYSIFCIFIKFCTPMFRHINFYNGNIVRHTPQL